MSVKQYEAAFRSLDKDNSGHLDFKELEILLQKMGVRSKMSMFQSMDHDGDNKVSIGEFLLTLGIGTPEEIKEANMRSLFRGFDKNGDGNIDRSEIDAVFKEMGKTMSSSELQRCQQLMDKDGDEKVDYEEFMEYFFNRKSK